MISAPARLSALLPIVFGLAACVASPERVLVASPSGGIVPVTMRTDVSHRFIAFNGPKDLHGPPFLGVSETNFYALRSWLDRETGIAAHQLYVSDSYAGPERGWSAARLEDGEDLPFVAISLDVIACEPGCAHVEDFGANLTDAQLRAHPFGLAVIFRDRSGGAMRIAVRGDRILTQLAAVGSQRAALNLADPGSAPSRPVLAGTSEPAGEADELTRQSALVTRRLRP